MVGQAGLDLQAKDFGGRSSQAANSKSERLMMEFRVTVFCFDTRSTSCEVFLIGGIVNLLLPKLMKAREIAA